MTYKKTQKRRKNKSLIIIGFTTICFLGTGFFYYINHRNAKPNDTPTSVNSPGIKKVNLDLPTEEEKAPARDSPVKPTQVTTSEGAKNKVTPTITSADAGGARAFVPGIIEEGGTCTAVFKSIHGSITATSGGFSNASYTSCRYIALSTPLSKGSWTATVSYSSPTSQGESQTLTFEVQ